MKNRQLQVCLLRFSQLYLLILCICIDFVQQSSNSIEISVNLYKNSLFGFTSTNNFSSLILALVKVVNNDGDGAIAVSNVGDGGEE